MIEIFKKCPNVSYLSICWQGPERSEVYKNILHRRKYSEKLAQKPRWLVFNKIDLMNKAEAEAKAKAIADAMGWEDKYYLISAASQVGVKDLCWDVMTFIIENPVVQAEEAKQPEKVEFMWDDYHRQQLEELEAEEDDEDWDDDWDEDDEEGVEFIYKH